MPVPDPKNKKAPDRSVQIRDSPTTDKWKLSLLEASAVQTSDGLMVLRNQNGRHQPAILEFLAMKPIQLKVYLFQGIRAGLILLRKLTISRLPM